MQRSIIFNTGSIGASLEWLEESGPNPQSQDYDVQLFRWKMFQLSRAGGIPVFLHTGVLDGVNTVDWESVSDLSEYEFLARSTPGELEGCIRRGEELGATPYLSLADDQQMVTWLDYVDPRFVKRNVERIPAGEVFDFDGDPFPNRNIMQRFSRMKTFFKTERKSSRLVYCAATSRVPIDSIHKYLTDNFTPDEPMLVSEFIDFVKDEQRVPEEYRCWVIDGKVASVYRYPRYESEVVPDGVRDFAHEFFDVHAEVLPASYVVDVGVDKTKGPLVVECNGLTCSGINPVLYEPTLDVLAAFYADFDRSAAEAKAEEMKSYEKTTPSP